MSPSFYRYSIECSFTPPKFILISYCAPQLWSAFYTPGTCYSSTVLAMSEYYNYQLPVL